MKKNFILRSIIICFFLSLTFQSFGQLNSLTANDLETGNPVTIFQETNAPTGEVRFPAEFEPVQDVIVVYPLNLPWELLQEITEDDTKAKLITLVNRRKTQTAIDDIKSEYTTNGVDINNCKFIEVEINSEWVRDFGPWCIFNNKEAAIVDNIYNRSYVDDKGNAIATPTWNNTRWRDDMLSQVFDDYYDIPLYGMNVVHTGGNMMQDGLGVGISDNIVYSESQTFLNVNEDGVDQKMNDYLGIDNYHVTIDPQGDYIAHVDCWAKLLAPDKILIARVPESNEQYDEYEEVASYFENADCCWGYPYKVYRVDVPVDSKENIKDSDKIAPYTNSLIVNKKVFVPINPSTSSTYNDAALNLYREIMLGYEVVGIEYNGWLNTDALHCRTRDVMDFNMLFVDHRNVVFGERNIQDSYPITAKFIAYSGVNITSTQLHYSINGGAYTTVAMTKTGNADEYTANITACNVGDVVKYYVTGEDASGRTCSQPIFGELDPHTFTVVGEGGLDTDPEQPVDPQPTAITLTANTTTITADGTDAVTFTVWQGTTDVTEECTFYHMTGANPQGTDMHVNNPFTTDVAKDYTIYAKYGDLTSNTVTITATPPITIAFSKDTFVADGEDFITVTVWQGTTDVTSECDIYYEYNSKHTQYTEDKFTTTNAGTYTFYANKGDLWSDDYPIVATEPEGSDEPEQPGEGEKETKEISGKNINEVGANGSDIYRIPISTYNKRSLSQHYYTQSEIDKNSGNITQIAFKLLSVLNGSYNTETTINEAISRNIEIYMRNVDTSSFGTSTETITFEENDKVYEGTINLGLTKGWVTIDLNVPFEYDGRNILICINDATCEWTDYKLLFEAFSADSRTLFISGDETTPYDVNKEISNYVKSYNVVPSVQFTFAEGSGEEPTPSIDLTKYYRIKSVSQNQYLHIKGYNGAHATNSHGDVGLSEFIENDYDQIFKIESTRDGSYYFVSASGYSIVCSTNGYNVDAYDNAASPIGIEIINETQFYILNGTKYFKVEADTQGNGDYPYCDADLDAAETWTLEEATVPVVLSADKDAITADDTDAVTFTVMQGATNVTEGCTFYHMTGANPQGTDMRVNNPFTTDVAKDYTIYAKYEDLTSNTVTITATEPESEESEGNGETVYRNGSVTYNKGWENEYTLLAVQDPNTGIVSIKEDNVYYYGSGNKLQIERKSNNKPKAATVLTIPEKVLFQTEEVTDWVTVTKIEDYAFDNFFEYNDYDSYEPGNELNNNFSGLIIPSTITEIGTYTFGFEMEGSIVCYAKNPPALSSTTTNNPFLENTYNNTILYVLPESIDEYEEAIGWGKAAYSGYYFKNIAPLTIPTFVGDGNWDDASKWRTYIKNATDDNYTEQWGVMPNAGVDVLINGNVIIPDSCIANVGAINIVSGGITIKDGGQLIHTNAGVSVTVEKEISGYGDGFSWNTISSPIAIMTKTEKVNGLLNGAYDLYYYDEPTHYWINHEQGTNGFITLDAGRGYLYANQNDVTLKFSGVINYDNVNFQLDATSEYVGLKGFNLIGNPYTHDIYMGGNIYSENLVTDGYYSLSAQGQWGAVKSFGTPIAPCQGILIQTSKEENIYIVKSAAAPINANAEPSLAIKINNEQYNDEAYVMFKNGTGLNKVGHINENIPMVYVTNNNEHFAIATMNEDVKEINLGFEAMTMGEYTIEIEEQDCSYSSMILTDNVTGKKTNLLNSSYTFLATTTDDPNRFTLTLNNDNDNDNDFIYINNNEMIINNIEGDGLVYIYDMMGRSVATYNVSGSANINIETLSNGVYVVRMTDNNGVKTQKVVND